MPFSAPNRLPPHGLSKPEAPLESEETANRVPAYAHQAAKVPKQLRSAVNERKLNFMPELPESMRHAVEASGRKHTEKLMRRTAERLSSKGVRFGTGGYDPLDEEEEYVEEEEEEPELLVRPFEDNTIRRTFTELDLNGNDFIEASELRHVFAQLGEMPSDNEISAMIHLCDRQGNGTVNFDDFLGIFADPAGSLRIADVPGLKRLLPRKKVDFDIRDALGMIVEEKTKLREIHLLVEEVRKNSQAEDAGVKRGWKVILLDDVPVNRKKDFESRIIALQDAIDPQKQAAAKLAALSKGAKPAEDTKKVQNKYDYSITFAVNPGDVEETGQQESSSEETPSEDSEDDEDEA
jgi:calmodulin